MVSCYISIFRSYNKIKWLPDLRLSNRQLSIRVQISLGLFSQRSFASCYSTVQVGHTGSSCILQQDIYHTCPVLLPNHNNTSSLPRFEAHPEVSYIIFMIQQIITLAALQQCIITKIG
jgi:hypothetical protein